MTQSKFEKAVLRKLEIGDANRLTEMYKSVEINKENYKEKFSDGNNSFKDSGGMFVINDYDENMRLLSDKDEILMGAELDGKIEGMICYKAQNWDYPYEEISYFEDCKDYKQLVEDSLKANAVFPGKEIIVMNGARGKLAYRLFLELLTDGLRHGYKYMSGEVYRATGYEDEDGFHKLDMLNMPSFMTLKKTGGKHIGTAKAKTVVKEQIVYYIEPQVFLWKLDESIETVKKILNSGVDFK